MNYYSVLKKKKKYPINIYNPLINNIMVDECPNHCNDLMKLSFSKYPSS
jgi:hypothetical protein